MLSYQTCFDVARGDYDLAGQASRKVKRTLQQIGIDNQLIRKIAIACYEGEINLAIHSLGGHIILEISETSIILKIEDFGPGIEDVELAMTEGFSTASEEARELGFGAGMGLPNMKNCADCFEIESKMGVGTNILLKFEIQKG